ncbi:MAG: hypothetical protein NT062_07390 [Proteobacteria bacterium]|nr:hypothetical protein [Pseudomonadota bacterium]
MKKLISTTLIGVLIGGSALAQPGTPVPNEPGANGPGLGVQPTTAAKPPLVLTPAELDALGDVEKEYDRFLTAANEHDARMRLIAKHEFDTRTAAVEKKYAERLAKAEHDKVDRHANAIKLLEQFVFVEHPHHDIYTPDKMFQLADLYRDQADADVDARLAALETTGQNATPDQPIVADYSKALDLWEKILKDFPTYRQTPATLYLLAYYGKPKDDRRSLQVFLSLACANHFKWSDAPPPLPTPKEARARAELKTLRTPYSDCTPYPGADVELTRHAWVRGIADYHFAVPGEIDEAIQAYLKVADSGQDSKLFAESLYKLAWSYYKRDFLKDSIKRFDQSVKLYDSIVAAGNTPALELRDESIQYIAVSFTDPWEGEQDSDPVKALARAKEFYAGRENEPHVRDVWVALGKAFQDIQAWDQAVDAYKIAIGPPWELNSKNPVVHQEIVTVFELKGDKFAADAAAGELATRYAPGTAWYAANEKDREAMENQRQIAEKALYAAAKNTHATASEMRKDYDSAKTKDPQLKTDYLAMYAKAGELYAAFVKTYPESDYIYEFNFLQGEALYWGERYKDAIVQYKWVRDHRDIGTKFYLDAARSIVDSLVQFTGQEVAAGRLVALHVPSEAEIKALPQPIQPQPIPSIYLELQGEYDNYQNVIPDPSIAPLQGINGALISLAYNHVDDSVGRLKIVMDKFCHSPSEDPKNKSIPAPAAKAKDIMLTIFLATGNLDAVENTNKTFIANTCGDQSAIEAAVSQNRSLNFTRAGKLLAEKQYVPAAEAFYKFYKTAPAKDQDLPTALYNAAVAYKLGERPKTAIALFKEFTSNPAKNFRESPYYLDAMRLTAQSYQGAFDYTNAVKTYLELYATTKKARQLGIKPPPPIGDEKPVTLDQIGLDALYNAAFASELNRDFAQATQLYTQYGNVETDHRKKDRALWSIGGIYRQSGDVISMGETLDKWRRLYGGDAGNEDDFVLSFYDTAYLWKKKGNTGKFNAEAQATIDAWKKRGAIKKGRGAQLAGEFGLQQVEAAFATWEAFQITTAAPNLATFKTFGKQLGDKKAAMEDKILTLDQFDVLEYSLAAKLRFGDVQFTYAGKLQQMPIPKFITGAAIEVYTEQLDGNTKKFTGEAKKQWEEVVSAGKTAGVSNKWTRTALEELGREFPTEYRPLRQEIIQGTDAP